VFFLTDEVKSAYLRFFCAPKRTGVKFLMLVLNLKFCWIYLGRYSTQEDDMIIKILQENFGRNHDFVL